MILFKARKNRASTARAGLPGLRATAADFEATLARAIIPMEIEACVGRLSQRDVPRSEKKGDVSRAYDLKLDPYELQSMHAGPRYVQTEAALEAVLQVLRFCKGDTCRRETGPIPDPS
jgi:hypothetical protein